MSISLANNKNSQTIGLRTLALNTRTAVDTPVAYRLTGSPYLSGKQENIKAFDREMLAKCQGKILLGKTV